MNHSNFFKYGNLFYKIFPGVIVNYVAHICI